MDVLRTRRGLGLLAFATVMAVACVLLGLWQLDRYEQRGERNEAVRAALAAEPVALETLLPSGSVGASPSADGAAADVATEVEWRPVVVRGTYDPAGELALRLRPVEGQAGVHVMTPLVLEGGGTVLVDRGFVPASSRSVDDVDLPTAPSGVVEVTGRVRLSEEGRGAGLDSDSSPPSVRFVDLTELRQVWDETLAPVWLERVESVPDDDPGLAAVPPPRLSSGTSLIYAVQWFLFGVIAVVGFVVLARRDGSRTSGQPV